MFVDVRGHHVEVTPAIKTYVNEKIEKLNRHNHNITTVNVILKVEKSDDHSNHKAEGLVKFKGHQEIFIETKSNDMYKSIDDLIDRLDRKVVEQKEKKHR